MTISSTLTDDGIDSIISDLHDYIIRHPLMVEPNHIDEGYDHFQEYVWNLLEPYSNGYRNYN